MVSLSLGAICRQVLYRLLRPRRRHKRRSHPLYGPAALEALEARALLSGIWTPLANLAPSSTGTMLLLTDGTVMVQGGGQASAWYQLTPDSSGSYVNGTWGQLASMSHTRLYFASNVLPDGRVFLVGGEYSDAGSFTRTGEIYDPTIDAWTNIQPFPNPNFGDDPSELLPDGRVLAGYLSGPQTYIYDPGSDSWTFAANKLRNDRSDEETWMKLPDDSILSYDVFNNGHAQRYIPSQNQWLDTGTVPVALSSSQVGFELGPAFLLPDGRAFFLGATGHTAFYDPATDSWTAGADIPNNLGADDAPGALMPNGHILVAADLPLFHGPTTIFEFDPTANTYTNVTPVGYSLSGPSYISRMLMLPSGDVLLTNGSNRLIVYTPDGSWDPSWQPTISEVDDNGDGTFTLIGAQLNGISEGASYGDDAEMSSNYPLVELVDESGDVFFARTFNWSSTGVATGAALVSTEFTLPDGIGPGSYSLYVVANGIASDPVDFTIDGGRPGAVAKPVQGLSGTPGGSPISGANPPPQPSSAAGRADVSSPTPDLSSATGQAAFFAPHSHSIWGWVGNWGWRGAVAGPLGGEVVQTAFGSWNLAAVSEPYGQTADAGLLENLAADRLPPDGPVGLDLPGPGSHSGLSALSPAATLDAFFATQPFGQPLAGM